MFLRGALDLARAQSLRRLRRHACGVSPFVAVLFASPIACVSVEPSGEGPHVGRKPSELSDTTASRDTATTLTKAEAVVAVSLELSAMSRGKLGISVCDSASALTAELAHRLRDPLGPFAGRTLVPCTPDSAVAEGKIVVRAIDCTRGSCMVRGEYHQYSSVWTLKAVTRTTDRGGGQFVQHTILSDRLTVD
jgi:hypothetical protein